MCVVGGRGVCRSPIQLRGQTMQRGVRRSVVDTSGHSAATHRAASGGLNAVDVRDARGAPVHLDLCDAEDLLQLTPCDSDLAGKSDIHVYIVPDGAGRLLRVVDGGSARGLLQLADVTAIVEEAALAMQGAQLLAEPLQVQLIFSQHLSATEYVATSSAGPVVKGWMGPADTA